MILYPAGAPLPSSKIILIILDGNMSDGIVPEYLENKSLSKSFVRVISLNFNKFSTVENLYTLKQEILSEKGTYIARIGKISNILIVTISSTGKRDLNYLEPDFAVIQNFKVKDSFSSITGNKSSAGQLTIENNRIKVVATDETKRLIHSFMGQIVTQII